MVETERASLGRHKIQRKLPLNELFQGSQSQGPDQVREAGLRGSSFDFARQQHQPRSGLGLVH